mgnify:FL=1
MTAPKPLPNVRALLRESRRLHRTRYLRHAWVRAKMLLGDTEPRFRCHTFYAKMPTS